jgi:redox-sensitive bicupin YhaK (pirin superfamily)
MFPLLNRDKPNRLELFQIWLNLPAKHKLADPYFTMLWDNDMPRRRFTDGTGHTVEVTVIAGAIDGVQPLAPPPHSWAANPEAEVANWSIAIEPGATWMAPPVVRSGVARTLHVFSGRTLKVGDRVVSTPAAIEVSGDQPMPLEAVDGPVEILLLQGRPIDEPVAQYGPFVMNTRAELEQAFSDYRRTQFGGWPFSSNAPVHPREQGRFARHADGRVEHAAA